MAFNYTIILLENPEQKAQSCREITVALPDWFGLPEANENYAAGIKEATVFAAYYKDILAGIIAIKTPFPNNADIYWMGVKPKFHRQGIGKMLLQAAEKYVQRQHCQTMTVETLSLKHDDLGYKKTYQFYEKMGFVPLFELTPYDTGYPMVYMMKRI